MDGGRLGEAVRGGPALGRREAAPGGLGMVPQQTVRAGRRFRTSLRLRSCFGDKTERKKMKGQT